MLIFWTTNSYIYVVQLLVANEILKTTFFVLSFQDVGQLSIIGTIHQLGVVTNSLEPYNPVNQIDLLNKSACQMDKDKEARRQIDEDSDQIPPIDEDTKAVHQMDTTQKSLHQKGETSNFQHVLCEICGKKFKNSYFYSKHMKLHIPNVHVKVKIYSCKHCGKYFSAQNQLESHQKIHLGKRYKCPKCKRDFSEKSEVKQHIWTIHENVKHFIQL